MTPACFLVIGFTLPERCHCCFVVLSLVHFQLASKLSSVRDGVKCGSWEDAEVQIWGSTYAQRVHTSAECASFLLICKLTAEHADGPRAWFSVITAYARCRSHAGVTVALIPVSTDSYRWNNDLFLIFPLSFQHILWWLGSVPCGPEIGSVLTVGTVAGMLASNVTF